MRTAALISGGKDSCYNMMQCVAHGHEIVALGNLHPESKDELDSYMFQTVGHQSIQLYAEAMTVPLYRRQINGSSVSIGTDYEQNMDDEVEDLYALLKEMKEKEDIEAVSVGAILSDYQRVRVENVCNRLGLIPLAYLWRRDQTELLHEMISCGVDAIIIKVASWGLVPSKFLGISLKTAYSELLKMKEKFGLNVCGEGGEYETFTLDCPLFNKKLKVTQNECHIECADEMSPVGYMNLKEVQLVEKEHLDSSMSLSKRIKHLPLKRDSELMKELELIDLSDNDNSDDENNEFCAVTEQLDCKSILAAGPRCSVDNNSIYITGLYGLKDEHKSVGQMTQSIMEKLQDLLTKHGFLISDLVVVHLFVKNMTDFQEINSTYKTFFKLNPPARVCVEVTLPDPVLLQVDCLSRKCSERKTLHVQGLSHWAPANIGPYSQAVKVNNQIFVAGQIALRPTSLCILPGGIIPESRLSLRHVTRVLKAVSPSTDINSILLAICYVTKWSHIVKALSEWKLALSKTEDRNEPLLEVVVVSHLPKNALVEWQVYAESGDEFCSVMCDDVKIGNLSSAVKIYYQDEEPGVMNSKISALSSRKADTITNEHLKSILQSHIVNYMDKYRLPRSWTLFYRTSSITWTSLQLCIQEVCDSLPAAPVITTVPIQSFYSVLQIFSICT